MSNQAWRTSSSTKASLGMMNHQKNDLAATSTSAILSQMF
jgi:hypothetical protein